MFWILAILLIGVAILLSGCKPKPIIPNPPGPEPLPPDPPPEPLPDPIYSRWQQIDKSSPDWLAYCEYMKKITSDSLLALELIKTVDGKKFYVWTAEIVDKWESPVDVWLSGKVDCDGFSRFTSHIIGYFIMPIVRLITEVYFMEYYGYYRKYVYNPATGEYSYKVVLGGHAITVYKKNEELLAFSNTNWWWNKDFQDFVEIGEETFPEGIVLIRCRHWETGILQWVQEALQGEILEGSCIFDREKKFEGKKADRDRMVI